MKFNKNMHIAYSRLNRGGVCVHGPGLGGSGGGGGGVDAHAKKKIGLFWAAASGPI